MWADNRRRGSTVVAMLLITTSICVVMFVPEPVNAQVWHVGGLGPGNFTSIQAAIDVAGPGDTVYVHEGTYHEKVVVDKSIYLLGEERSKTVVVGDRVGDVIQVIADQVTVSGFTVTNGNVGIQVDYSENCIIEGNNLHSNSHAMSIYNSNHTSVSFNYMFLNGQGIVLWGAHHTVLTDNIISSNYIGVWGGPSLDTYISDNLISSQRQFGIWLRFGGYKKIFHNTFVGNVRQALDDWSEADWHDGFPSGGNYWSDYEGVDELCGPEQNLPGSDGLGDKPYTVPYNGVDSYPLMSPPFAMLPGPRPPQNMEASLTGDESENVTIEWSLSEDDGGGSSSVLAYEIYRNSTYSPEGIDYGFISWVPNGISSYVDELSGEGDPNNYFYRVCAKDLYGNAACSPSQTAKYTRPLAPGPNLISLPLVQSDESLETVLQTVEYDRAWSYDGNWSSYMKDKTYSSGFRDVNHMMGIWVNVTKNCNLTLAGIVPAQTAINLRAGWNLVSFPSINTSYSVADLKADTGAMRIEGYDPAPPYFLRVLENEEVFQAGYGYWIKVQTDTMWLISY